MRPRCSTTLPFVDDVTVRPAREEDVDALVHLRAEMFAAMGVTEADDRWREQARQWFAARLHDDHYRFAVVEVSGRVVACAAGAVRDAAPSPGAPEGRDVLVSNVCTMATHRGHGYGQAAFEHVLDWARRSGVARAELMATASGRGLYERAGFTETAFPAMRVRLS